MSSLPVAFLVLYLVVATNHLVRSFRLHRRIQMRSRDRSVEGRTAQRDHPWGWPEPPVDLGLQRHETDERSVLVLPLRRTSAEIFGSLLGYLFLGAALWISILMLVKEVPEMTGVWLIGLVFFTWPGWVLLQAGSKLARIELTDRELRFVLRFGIFLYRSVRFSRRSLARANFAVALQRLFTMEVGQEQPDVVLRIKRRLRSDVPLLLNCSLEAATWIDGVLEEWKEPVGEVGARGPTF